MLSELFADVIVVDCVNIVWCLHIVRLAGGVDMKHSTLVCLINVPIQLFKYFIKTVTYMHVSLHYMFTKFIEVLSANLYLLRTQPCSLMLIHGAVY